MTLANISNSRYGTTQIGAYTLYFGTLHLATQSGNCKSWVQTHWGDTYIDQSDLILCDVDTSTSEDSALNIDELSSVASIDGLYWSKSEYIDIGAYARSIYEDVSTWSMYSDRSGTLKALCVGD